MEGLIGLGVVVSLLGVAYLIGWGASVLFDTYWKYRVKKNRTNHPKLIELQKERERLCKEYHQWWDEKNEARKRLDINYEILKEYDIDRETVMADINEFVEKLRTIGAICE